MPVLNDRLDALTHKLLHRQSAVTPVNASDIVAGTFGSGNYVFPSTLDVTSTFRSKGTGTPGSSRFWDGLELAHPSSTPYIDFHRSTNPEEATDYNMRIINSASTELSVLGGKFVVDSTVGTNVIAKGTGGGYEFQERDTAASWVLYSNAGLARMWKGSDLAQWGPIVNGTESGYKVLGNDQAVERYASGWFRSTTSGTGWYHQVHGGGIYMNDAWIRTYGSKSFYCDQTLAANYIYVDTMMYLNDHVLRLRASSDPNHYVQWGSITGGGDGARVYGYYGSAVYSAVAAAEAGLQQDGNFVLYDNGSSWGMKNIPSGLATKTDIEPYPDGALAKVLALRPVSFKRKYYDSRSDLRKELKIWKNYQKVSKATEKREEHFSTEQHLELAEQRFGPGGRLHSDSIQVEMGFIAEEVLEVEPMAVFPATQSSGIGLYYQQMTALLTKAMQELTSRVQRLESG